MANGFGADARCGGEVCPASSATATGAPITGRRAGPFGPHMRALGATAHLNLRFREVHSFRVYRRGVGSRLGCSRPTAARRPVRRPAWPPAVGRAVAYAGCNRREFRTMALSNIAMPAQKRSVTRRDLVVKGGVVLGLTAAAGSALASTALADEAADAAADAPSFLVEPELGEITETVDADVCVVAWASRALPPRARSPRRASRSSPSRSARPRRAAPATSAPSTPAAPSATR